ncbi:MAG: outer membrane protein [Pseudomonadota bacterium]
MRTTRRPKSRPVTRRMLAAMIVVPAGLSAAGAADLSRPFVKAPLVVAAAYDWSGFYAGVNAGYGVGSNPVNMSFTPAIYGGEQPTLGPSGALGGVQAGYNWQVDRVVLGLEGDVQASSMKQSICFDFCDPKLTLRTGQELSWFATVRGRAGITAGPALLYLTGGAAFTTVKTTIASVFDPYPASGGRFSEAKVGWVAGAGLEAALGGHWTAKVEYLYMDFGNVSHAAYDPFLGPSSPELFDIAVRQHVVRAGVNYLFNAPDGGPARLAATEPVHNWTGLYLGGHLSANAAHGPSTLGFDNTVFNESTFAARALGGGLQAGANWQAGALVLGAEADVQLAHQSQHDCFDFCLAKQSVDLTTRLPWFATLRGRIGYAAGPLLIYGTAGAALGRVEVDHAAFDGMPAGTDRFRDTRTGWVAGGGLEAALSERWSAKAEYLYLDLGRISGDVPGLEGGTENIRVALRNHTARIGLNYRLTP